MRLQNPVSYRMRLILMAVGSLIVGACYNSGGKNPAIDAEANRDAAKIVDGNTSPIDSPRVVPDAATTAPILGSACTGQGQGSCPVGYDCLNLTSGSGSWCSKQCTMGAGDTCDAGYNGPGVAACVLNVTPAAGPPAMPYCAIICQDEPAAPTLCAPATRCTNACTTPLACTGALTTTDGMLAGHVCR